MTTYYRRNFTRDDQLILKDAGLVAASAAATVSSAAKVLDLGEGFVKGNIVAEVTALDIDGNNELYDIVAQLSSVADFSTDTLIVDKCQLPLSAAEVKRTDSNIDSAVGRYVLPFDNEYAGVVYRYMRLYTICAGAGISTGINYSAFLARD